GARTGTLPGPPPGALPPAHARDALILRRRCRTPLACLLLRLVSREGPRTPWIIGGAARAGQLASGGRTSGRSGCSGRGGPDDVRRTAPPGQRGHDADRQ